MSKQEQTWDMAARYYGGFRKVEAYRQAQDHFATAMVDAVDLARIRNSEEPLRILDLASGTLNNVDALLGALKQKNFPLYKVNILGVERSEEMLSRAKQKLPMLKKKYSGFQIDFIHSDIRDSRLPGRIFETLGGSADISTASWLLDYFPQETRIKIGWMMRHITWCEGVIGFSSLVKLPQKNGKESPRYAVGDILKPYGAVQIFAEYIKSGKVGAIAVVGALKELAAFGQVVSGEEFPEKPTPKELVSVAEEVGLDQAMLVNQLFGTSAFVVAKNTSELTRGFRQGEIASSLPKKLVKEPELIGVPLNDLARISPMGFFRTLLGSRPN